MTPKEASIEIEQAIALIYHALNRNTNNATWRDLNDALVHIRKIREEFISPARNKPKPRHPPKVPAVPERRPVDPIMNTGHIPPETLRGIRDIMNSYRPLPNVEIINERKSISGGERPLGRLE